MSSAFMAAILSNSSLISIPTVSVLENCKTMSEIHQVHAHLIKTRLMNHDLTASKVLASYCNLGLSDGLDYASSILFRSRNPNPFMFFQMIKGVSDSSNPLKSFIVYAHLISCLEDFRGVEFSIPPVLKACGKTSAFQEGRQVHGQILKLNLWLDPFVSNSLVRMYLDVGETEVAQQVFDKMPQRDLISWNSMLTGYLRAGKIEMACDLFDQMPERNVFSCNAMIDGYGKFEKMELAEEIFKTMTDKDVISWTSMISAYVLNHRARDALSLFREMLSLGIRPDAPAIVSALSAVSNLGFAEEGKWIHTYISASKISVNSGFIASALIDMYAKCGLIENALQVFNSISCRRNIPDWNSIISGLALHGLGREAIEMFLKMEEAEIEPNLITFLGLLSACSHEGLIDEGKFYFKWMKEKYKMIPRIQHYGCLIDLFSRAGYLEDALDVLNDMPVEADVLAWKAVLTGSLKHGNVEIGEKTAFRAIMLAPNDSSSYILLSNIYAKVGRWNDVARVRSMMQERGVRKIPGCSSIIVNGKLHEFLAGKKTGYEYCSDVLSKIEEMTCKLKLEGYKPDLTQVLINVENEEKDNFLILHSEKLALAFGLIHTSKSAHIHIVKNLRICCDCHSFMKLVSKVYDRRIVLRDQNRFHHFENGSCSCNEYW